jgi:hypothetical protein
MGGFAGYTIKFVIMTIYASLTETIKRRRNTRYGTDIIADQPAREADQDETHCHEASTGRP